MKYLAKIVVVLLSTSLFTHAAVAQQSDRTLDKIRKTGVIAMGHRESSIPFSYYNDKQQVIGYSADIASKISDVVKVQLNMPDIKVKPFPITSQNRIPLLQKGVIDIECGSTTNNLERQRQAAFSNTIFIVSTRLMTKKSSGINDFPDLRGKTVVTTAGTTSERMLRKMNEKEKMGMAIISAKDHGEAFLALSTDRAVAFMMDDALLAGERAKSKTPQAFVIVGTPQSQEAYGCMLRKDDPSFKKLVDDTIAQLQTSGVANNLYKKWFESPIPPKGLNLNFPQSAAMKAVYQQPNDKALD